MAADRGVKARGAEDGLDLAEVDALLHERKGEPLRALACLGLARVW